MSRYEKIGYITLAAIGILLILTRKQDTGSNQLSYGPDVTTMKSDESAQY